MSLFTSFNSGVSGIHTAQSGLNTTAHNLSNTRTEGYTRQQNIQTDMYYNMFKTTDKSMMKVGYGSTVATVRQIRDEFLDKQYRTENSKLAFYEVQQITNYEVQDILGELDGVEFNQALNDMWATIQSFSENPEGVPKRELFIAKAEKFLDKAITANQSLRDYQLNLNSQVQSQVKEINKIADEIAELNLTIAKAEASGLENANDYRDRRNYLMDQLSNYTYFDSKEHANGMVTIRIDNAPLVDETMSFHMSCERMQYELTDPATGQPVTDANGNVIYVGSQMYKVVWEKGGYGDVYDLDKAASDEKNTDTGSLLGTLKARGQKYAYYTDIPVREDYPGGRPWKDALDKYNNTVGDCLLEKVQAQLDLLVNKVVKAINDVFSPNVDLSQGYACEDNGGAPLTSITVNGTQIDLTKVKVLDANRCPAGTDNDNTIGTELFVRKSQDRYTVYDVSGPIYAKDANGDYITDSSGNRVALTQEIATSVLDSNGNHQMDASGNPMYTYTYKLYVYNEEISTDVDSLYTIQNLKMNEKVQENYSYLPVAHNPGSGMTGAYNWDIYGDMLAKWHEKSTTLDPNALSTYGVDEYYDSMVGALSVQGSVWDSKVSTLEKETQDLEDKRQQIAGVSTEEEMVSLLMYQHAYNAASRYITVIDSMLEHIINRLG